MLRQDVDGHTYIYPISGLDQNNLTSERLNLSGLFEKSVQVLGNFGAAGTLTIEGSNRKTPGANDWSPLNDPFGNALIFSVEGLQAILEHTIWVRALVASADGDTDLEVLIAAKGR